MTKLAFQTGSRANVSPHNVADLCRRPAFPGAFNLLGYVDVGLGTGHKKVSRAACATRRRRVNVISEVVEMLQIIL